MKQKRVIISIVSTFTTIEESAEGMTEVVDKEVFASTNVFDTETAGHLKSLYEKIIASDKIL